MNRDELLTRLAMELAEWPAPTVDARRQTPRGIWGVHDGEWECFAKGDCMPITEYSYRQRRSELINKPSWDDAPDWAEFLMKINTGDWFWLASDPSDDLAKHRWYRVIKNQLAAKGEIHNGADWGESTLERRPKAQRLGDIMTDCKRCGGQFDSTQFDECQACALHWRDDCHESLTFGPIQKGRAGGLKFDGDKPRMELLMQGMPRALWAIGEVMTGGAEKYSAHSWKEVEEGQNRYWAAKTRHELARAMGQQHDPESGFLHLAHEAVNALFLLELALLENEE